MMTNSSALGLHKTPEIILILHYLVSKQIRGKIKIRIFINYQNYIKTKIVKRDYWFGQDY